MRSESANIHQENENSDVVLMSHEEEMPICKEILENQDNKNEDVIEQDKVFFLNQVTNESKVNDNIWITKSCASCHIINSLEGMTNLKNNYLKIKIRSSKTMMAIERGTYNGIVVSKDNRKTTIQL